MENSKISPGGRELLEESAQDDDYVLYFAYGSNMSAESLQGKGCKVQESTPGIANGWALVFNCAGHPFREPAYASLRRVANSQGPSSRYCHGVVHKISKVGFEKLAWRLEDGDGRLSKYARQDINILCYTGRRVSAVTFVGASKTIRENVVPSKRYLNLLKCAARKHSLDPEYIRQLDQQLYYAPGLVSAALVALFLLVHLPLMVLGGLIGMCSRPHCRLKNAGNTWARRVLRRNLWALHDSLPAHYRGHEPREPSVKKGV